MTKRTHKPVAEADRLLRSIEPLRRRLKVRRAMDRHFDEPGRTDLRGRKSAELRKAATTLRHIVGMQRWVLDNRYDLNVRRRIGDFLKHIDHNQPWARTVDECRKARGLANRAARAFNDNKEYGPGTPVILSPTYTSYPLNTVAKLRSAGKRGGNCLRYNHYDHHDELRHRIADFHEIRKSDVPVAWLRLKLGSRRVTDIHGPSNDEANLPAKVLRKLCTNLNVTGDYEDTFFRKGVLTIFLSGKADSDVPMEVVSDYRFWWRAGEIVLHDVRDDQWSRFLRRSREWQAVGPSVLDDDAFKAMRRVNARISSIALRAKIMMGRRKYGRAPSRRRAAGGDRRRGRGRPTR